MPSAVACRHMFSMAAPTDCAVQISVTRWSSVMVADSGRAIGDVIRISAAASRITRRVSNAPSK